MLNQSLAETNLFDLFGLNAVAGDVIDSVRRPDELVNLHSLILQSLFRGPEAARSLPQPPQALQIDQSP